MLLKYLPMSKGYTMLHEALAQYLARVEQAISRDILYLQS